MNVLCVGITKWCYNIRKWGHVTQKFYSSPTVFFLPKSVISQGRIINKSIKVTVVHPGCHLVPTTAHRSSSFNIKVYVISLLEARKNSVFSFLAIFLHSTCTIMRSFSLLIIIITTMFTAKNFPDSKN